MTDASKPDRSRKEPSGQVRSGFVTLVGRPNTGKSTLVNAVAGSKVAIVSDRPQTTRHRLRAVIDSDESQIVLVDTPGVHKPKDALGEQLNRTALATLADVDVACLVVDASQEVGRGDAWVARHVAAVRHAAIVLVMTKADLVDQDTLNTRASEAIGLLETGGAEVAEVVAVSARTGFNVDGFVAAVQAHLPTGPRYFPRDMATDQPIEMMIGEFIREKVVRSTFDEVPHAVGVAVEDVRRDESNDTTTIHAVIFVERESQKGILIGKGGERIKRTGIEAREDLERLLGEKVYLDLMVKVKKDWRRDAGQVRRFGYGEGL